MYQIPKFHVQSLTLRDFKGRNSAQYISNLMLMITYQSVCCKPVVHLSYNFRSISSTKSPLVRGRNLVLPQFTSRPKKKKELVLNYHSVLFLPVVCELRNLTPQNILTKKK